MASITVRFASTLISRVSPLCVVTISCGMKLCSHRRGSELQMQLLQSAQKIDRLMLVAAGAGGAVHLLRDADVAEAFEQPVETGTHLGARQRSARAGMRPAAEGQVFADIRPAQLE